MYWSQICKKFVSILISQLVKVEIELIYRYSIYWFLINFGILIANMQTLNVLDNYVIMLISTTNLNLWNLWDIKKIAKYSCFDRQVR